MYIKSIYITASDGYPVIAYVLGVTPNTVVYGKTLDDVLVQLYGKSSSIIIEEDALEQIKTLWEEYMECTTHECMGKILDQIEIILFQEN